MRKYVYGFVLFLALGILLSLPAQAASKATKILYGGKVFTADKSRPWAQAVAIRGKQILDVGSDKQIMKWAGPHTERIDLKGRTVIPGINDSHVHIPMPVNGQFINYPDFAPQAGPTLNDMIESISQAAAYYPEGTWLFGWVGQTVMEDPQANRFTIDAVASRHPVLLCGIWGHTVYLNTKAMQTVGISETEPDPFGGSYQRMPNSNILTGAVYEYAQWGVVRYLMMNSPTEMLQAVYQQYFAQALQWGVTSLQDMPLYMTRDKAKEILTNMDLPLRMRSMDMPLNYEESRSYSEGYGENKGGDRLKFSGVKWIADGAPVDWSSALTEPYFDRPDKYGSCNFPADVFKLQVRDALCGALPKQQRIFHAIGDLAVDRLLTTMSATGSNRLWKTRRVRLEHGDLIRPDQIAAIKDKGVIVVPNPFFYSTVEFNYLRFGPERMAHMQLLRSLLDAGIPIAFGTDSIGVPMNPFVDIMMAAAHPTNPAEAISVEEAVTAYTYGSAFAEFQEQVKGTLQPGRLADLTVLSQDIFTVPVLEIANTVSVLTLVGGEVVYENKNLF